MVGSARDRRGVSGRRTGRAGGSRKRARQEPTTYTRALCAPLPTNTHTHTHTGAVRVARRSGSLCLTSCKRGSVCPAEGYISARRHCRHGCTSVRGGGGGGSAEERSSFAARPYEKGGEQYLIITSMVEGEEYQNSRRRGGALHPPRRACEAGSKHVSQVRGRMCGEDGGGGRFRGFRSGAPAAEARAFAQTGCVVINHTVVISLCQGAKVTRRVGSFREPEESAKVCDCDPGCDCCD